MKNIDEKYAKYTHSPLTMKKLSEIQKTRNTKILLSDQDWEEDNENEYIENKSWSPQKYTESKTNITYQSESLSETKNSEWRLQIYSRENDYDSIH